MQFPASTWRSGICWAACAKSPRGYDAAIVAAKAMARTAIDLIEQPELVAAVRGEFEAAS